MKKINIKDQSGFGAVELLIVLVIIGLLAGAGWYVYSRQDKTAEQPISTTQEESKEVAEEADVTENWLLYSSPDKKYSIRLADGWKLHYYDDEVNRNDLLTNYAEDIEYSEGTEAVVTRLDAGGRGGPNFFALNYGDSCDSSRCSTEGVTEEASLKTNDGLEVTKKSKAWDDISGDPYFKEGDTTYYYEISSGDNKVLFIYDHLKTNESQIETVEQVIKTFSFK